jgi:hypothetical protein
MTDQQQDNELSALLDGLKTDAAAYFTKAAKVFEGENFELNWEDPRRDRFWRELPEEIRGEGGRLDRRLTSLMGQIVRAVRNAPLVSEADEREVMTGTKAMRSALLLREFCSWDAEVLHDEDIVLGIRRAGQSDDKPSQPYKACRTFVDWAQKINAILDLVAASPGADYSKGGSVPGDTARYRPGTAFIMMWMDKSKPDLTDVSDAVKEVFGQFGIHGVRADDIEHEGLITPRILDEIRTAEFCFADLSGARPNVYYEVGYAHALTRRVILFRKIGTGLHFDLAGYNCPAYENLRDLKEKLTTRLRALTNKEPKSSSS